VTKLIRTTTHHFFKYTNATKVIAYKKLYTTSVSLLKWYVDYLWSNKVCWGTNRVLDIANGKYDCPSFISTTNIKSPFDVAARLEKSIVTQACGIIKSVLSKNVKSPTKPAIGSNHNLELNSINVDFQNGTHFDFWIRFKSFGLRGTNFKIPIRHHKHSLKYARKATRLNSILMGPNYIDIRWEFESEKNNGEGLVGADQGINTVLALSDSKTTPSSNASNWTLSKILDKMARQKKGSKAFKRSQDHRTNFINWSINQLNLHKYKQINLEDVKYLRQGKKTSRKLSHWTYTLIKKKVKAVCEVAGVQLSFTPSYYRSQRCSQCGWVKKSSRNGSKFNCESCNYSADADVNAAINNSLNLKLLDQIYLNKGSSLKGFFWEVLGS